ncbi:MAG: EFR1 family ferrodoxin [Oscillospiraceae bacterium]|nr:EFR1 family ferrodoxin [Oscillospiraceae bacterium]
MIFYFSSTGNCKYVAEQIAAATHDTAASIVDCLKQRKLRFPDTEVLGIISPTYAIGLPDIVDVFLRNLEIKSNYTFFIATYGTTPGLTGYFAEKYLKNPINAKFSIRMPDNFTPWFDLSDADKVACINEKADKNLRKIIHQIRARETGNFMPIVPPAFMHGIHPPAYDSLRKTEHFHVESTCIGCGKCASQCPVHAIQINDGKPVWVKEKCTMCLGCLHHCPMFAIQYENKTKEHGQYQHP